MAQRRYLQNVLIGATAVVVGGGTLVTGNHSAGPVLSAAVSFVSGGEASVPDSGIRPATEGILAAKITAALDAFATTVRPLSHPRALEDAFRSYFAYRTA